MFLFLLFTSTLAFVEEVDCGTINRLLRREHKMEKPVILLLYYKYGAIYQQIKNDWNTISQLNPNYDFMQLDMKENQENCIVGIFPTNQLPYGIYIDQKYDFFAELVREVPQIITYIQNPSNYTVAPFPQYSQFRVIENIFTNYLFKQAIKAIGAVSLVIILIWFRLSIYKDQDEEEKNKQK